jgi:hypothetical protein
MKNNRQLRLIETGIAESTPSCEDEIQEPGVADYRPSVFYFRRAIRDSYQMEELREIAMHIVRELENVRAWMLAEFEITGPKKWVMRSEMQAKPWMTKDVEEQSSAPPTTA